MRIESVRISGFKPIPFCATYTEANGSTQPAQIRWNSDAFEFKLPVGTPMLSSLIGHNSSGKSTIFSALDCYLGSTTKLSVDNFNDRKTDNPVIIEISFVGDIDTVGSFDWSNQLREDRLVRLTVANVWSMEGRTTLEKCENGTYKKIVRNLYGEILPQFRLIPSIGKIGDAANPDKKTLINDLVGELAKRQVSNRSIIHKLRKAIAKIERLADRSSAPNATAWREVEALESFLSDGLGSITPGSPKVQFELNDSLPSAEDLFLKSKIKIDDGIQLDFENHGLGLQRSFLVSALHAWWHYIGHSDDHKDYIFAIEEPELYLHPHAIRILISTLEDIATKDQVLFSSHSSEFVNRVPFENVCCLKRIGTSSQVNQPDLSDVSPAAQNKVRRYLREDRSDMLFAKSVLLVEGQAELFAIPEFAQKLGYSLDRHGVSVVCVNGNGNFDTYHRILDAFGIPHVILADGDGNIAQCQRQYGTLASVAYVFEHDFEYEIVSRLDDSRLLLIINLCRANNGKSALTSLGPQAEFIAPEDLSRYWRSKLQDTINGDIVSDHRPQYEVEKQQINEILSGLAGRVVSNGHVFPEARNKQRAALLQREGKPLAGRVLGETLDVQTLQQIEEVVNAIKSVCDLAK